MPPHYHHMFHVRVMTNEMRQLFYTLPQSQTADTGIALFNAVIFVTCPLLQNR